MRIYVDCDGVLTDGHLTINDRGEKQFKRFHTRDVPAIRGLIAKGWEVVIVTADDWGVVHHFASKVGASVIVTGQKGELPPAEIAIGDDSMDAPMLRNAKQAFCPADAVKSVRQMAGITVLETKGGQGVMAELREILG